MTVKMCQCAEIFHQHYTMQYFFRQCTLQIVDYHMRLSFYSSKSYSGLFMVAKKNIASNRCIRYFGVTILYRCNYFTTASNM